MTELNAFLTSETNQGIAAIFKAIEQASFIIHKEVSYQGLGADILGAKGSSNSTGDEQQKLDDFADHVFEKALRKSGHVAGWASEESDNFVCFDGNEKAEYVIVIDPLDGSSNIDVNVSIGTIFGIFKRTSKVGEPVELDDFLQPGKNQVAAGYVLYSVSTQLVFSTGNGLHIFTLEPYKKQYHRVADHVKAPADGKCYAINEVNFDDFNPKLKSFVQYCRDKRKADGKGNIPLGILAHFVQIFIGICLKAEFIYTPQLMKHQKGS